MRLEDGGVWNRGAFWSLAPVPVPRPNLRPDPPARTYAIWYHGARYAEGTVAFAGTGGWAEGNPYIAMQITVDGPAMERLAAHLRRDGADGQVTLWAREEPA